MQLMNYASITAMHHAPCTNYEIWKYLIAIQEYIMDVMLIIVWGWYDLELVSRTFKSFARIESNLIMWPMKVDLNLLLKQIN